MPRLPSHQQRTIGRWVAAACWLTFACGGGVQAASPSDALSPHADGPYVVRTAESRWAVRSVQATSSGAREQTRSVKAKTTVTVPAVRHVPAFRVKLRDAADAAPEIVSLSTDAPLFVVADTHGQFEILVEMLRNHRIVDRDLKWSFGRGHLVFLGDVFDRGPNHTEILWLIYQLEADAKTTGGGVHLVLGNHETMVLRGDLRYLHPKYPKTAEVLGVSSYAELFNADSVLGQWLRTKPAVLKINDLLFLHGGISREVVERKLTLSQINSAVRDTLNGVTPSGADKEQVEFVMGQLGPLWYRGYFADQKDFPTATSEDIDGIREHFVVDKIVVGHTIVPTVTPLYEGRVIAVQVYPHRDEKTGLPIMEALCIDRGRFLRAKINGTLEPLDIKMSATDGSVATRSPPPPSRRPN